MADPSEWGAQPAEDSGPASWGAVAAAPDQSASSQLPTVLGGTQPSYLPTLVGNLPSSAVKFAESTAQPFIHPIDTAESLKNVGQGVLEKFGITSGDAHEKYADAVGQFFKQRYGGWQNIQDTIRNDPVGTLADLSTVLTLGGTAAERVPGLVGDVGTAVRTAGDVTNPLNAITKPVTAAAQGTAKLGTHILGDIGTQTGAPVIGVSGTSGISGRTTCTILS